MLHGLVLNLNKSKKKPGYSDCVCVFCQFQDKSQSVAKVRNVCSEFLSLCTRLLLEGKMRDILKSLHLHE